MIDFTNLETRKKSYGGANGNKLSVVISNELYMLKLPSHADHNSNMSYANSSISEYLGCHIYNMLGISAQDTILGYYDYKEIKRICVACKDFETDGYKLQDFASIKNQVIDSNSNGYGTELFDVLESIELQKVIEPKLLSDYFWNMFIVDAILGNWDRHNGNWGFLYKVETDEIKLAPIFDCGSCLFPQLDESMINKILNSKQEMNARVYDFPTSSLTINKKRINYYKFIKSHEYEQCDKAIERIKSKINLNEINELIDSVEVITEKHKKVLKELIKLRIENMLY